MSEKKTETLNVHVPILKLSRVSTTDVMDVAFHALLREMSRAKAYPAEGATIRDSELTPEGLAELESVGIDLECYNIKSYSLECVVTGSLEE